MGGWRSVVVVVVVVIANGLSNRASDDDVTKQQSNSNTRQTNTVGSVGLIIIFETSLSLPLSGLVPLRGTY